MIDKKSIHKFYFSRRKFLKSIVATSIASQIPFIAGCNNNDSSREFVLTNLEILNLEAVLQIIFPNDNFGPDAKLIHAAKYIQWILLDKQIPYEIKNSITDGLKKANELAVSILHSQFYKLSTNEMQMIINIIVAKDWGEIWISTLINFIFEALLASPVYGGNTQEYGWKWLKHYSSLPQPTKQLKYPEIVEIIYKSDTEEI